MVKRLLGLDYGRGIAILGVIFCHSFMGRVANWNNNVLFDLASKTPIIVVVLLFMPVVVLCLMGSLFSFITAVCVTISSTRIQEKGAKYVWKYIFMKLVFSLILKALEDFWSQTLSNYNMFQSGKFEFPTIWLSFWAHTLDCVGFFSWSVPLCVFAVSSIKLFRDYRIQVAILTVVGTVLLYFNNPIVSAAAHVASWLKDKEFFFFYYLCTKIATGAFSIGQYFPFGLFGGAFGIIINHTTDFKYYWIYNGILSVIGLGFGIPLILQVDDLVSKVFDWQKPTGFLFLMSVVQSNVMLMFMHFTDNPKRPIGKRLKAMKRSTFLRRVNAVSLTAYIVEPRYSQEIYEVFKVFCGPGADQTAGICNWSWIVCAFFMVTATSLWVLIVKLWEFVDFRFSAEHQLSCIMGWLFKQPYNKMDYKSSVYQPIINLQQEIDAKKVDLPEVVISTGEGQNPVIELITTPIGTDKIIVSA